MLIADMFYRLSHHSDTGLPRIHRAHTDIGMAAAVMAEIIVSGHLTIDEHDDAVISTPAHAPDGLTAIVLEQFAREPRLPAKTWLRFLSRTASTSVAERLQRGREVSPARSGWRRQPTFRPLHSHSFEGPYAHLSITLRNRAVEEPIFRWCTAIAVANGLIRDLADNVDDAYLASLIGSMPPPGQALIRLTGALTAGETLTRRH